MSIAPPAPRESGHSRLANGWDAHPILRLLVRRILAGIVTLFVVSILVFAATDLVPGDAASAILGKQATGAQLRDMRIKMGLNHPAAVRYGNWLSGLVRGDLGNSSAGYAAGGRVSIWSEVKDPIENSLVLAGITFLLAIPLSLALGVAAALRATRTSDTVISVTTLALGALPEFVLGSALIVVLFSWLNLLPPVSLVAPGSNPLADPSKLVLPVLTLLGVTAGVAVRMVRAGMLDTLRADYVKMARLNGIHERVVVSRYALRNALAPSIQVFALILQYLLGGIIVVEFLFAYPGIGKELVDAVVIHDNLVVQTIAMLLAAAYVSINIVADVLVVVIVPRLRTAHG